MSRIHGKITAIEDQVKVKSCHVNPIFYNRAAVSNQEVLAKDSEILLNHSDTFSLMPNQYVYEIRVEQSERFVENEHETSASRPSLDEANDPERTPSPEYFQSKYPKLNENNQNQSSSMDKKRSHKRSLSRDNISDTSEEAKKLKHMPSDLGFISNVTRNSTSSVELPSSSTTDLENQLPTSSLIAIKPYENVQGPIISASEESSLETASNVLKDSASPVQLPSCSVTGLESQLPVQTLVTIKPDPDGDVSAKTATNQASSVPSIPVTVVVKTETSGPSKSTDTRLSCEFGIRCYRNQPEHRREFAHPNDQDYRRPNYPAASNDAPDCQYGKSCYRRNPEHFREFRHPSASK